MFNATTLASKLNSYAAATADQDTGAWAFNLAVEILNHYQAENAAMRASGCSEAACDRHFEENVVSWAKACETEKQYLDQHAALERAEIEGELRRYEESRLDEDEEEEAEIGAEA